MGLILRKINPIVQIRGGQEFNMRHPLATVTEVHRPKEAAIITLPIEVGLNS